MVASFARGVPGTPRATLADVIETRPGEDGVVASAFALVEIDEVKQVREGENVFTTGEEAYARAKRDPERRLAARLAAKRAARRLLGGGVGLGEIEVARGRYGPPFLRLSGVAKKRMAELGASRALVSLTHERLHAAAAVVLLRTEPDSGRRPWARTRSRHGDRLPGGEEE
jgi:holo-[acyl-carrier protein] synthase